MGLHQQWRPPHRCRRCCGGRVIVGRAKPHRGDPIDVKLSPYRMRIISFQYEKVERANLHEHMYSIAVQTSEMPNRSWGLGNVSAWGTLETPKSRVGKPDEWLLKAGISIVAGAWWWIVQCTH